MGLNKNQSTYQYVRIKNGKFYLSTDKECTTPYDELTGIIQNIFVKNETYEGNPVQKLVTVVESDGEKYYFSFNFESAMASTYIGFLKNADFSKPVVLRPISETVIKDNQESLRTTILVNQDGKSLKSFFTKDNPNGLPPMKQIKLNGKMVWDKTEMLDFYKNIIKEEFSKHFTESDNQTNTSTSPSMTAPSMGEVVDDDDLPF